LAGNPAGAEACTTSDREGSIAHSRIAAHQIRSKVHEWMMTRVLHSALRESPHIDC